MKSSKLKAIFDPGQGTRRAEALVLFIALAAAGYAAMALPNPEPLNTTSATKIRSPDDGETEAAEGQTDLSKFKHSNPLHSRMPCLLCHQRTEGVTTPRWPGHQTCSGCHQQQFAEGNVSAICSVCHTATGLKAFPPQRSFTARYDHARHAGQTNCATCHTPNRRGVGLSVPSGVRAHVTCFQCHGPDTVVGGRNIGSCGTCHVAGRPLRNSDASVAYTVNFSHQEHARKGMSCAGCHSIRAGQSRGRQVTAPLVSMHFPPARGASCGACHDSKRAFGISNFQNCRRCHEGRTFKFQR